MLVLLNSEKSHGNIVDIDDEIVDSVKLFNEKGWRTDFSCAGHYDSENEYCPFSYPYISFVDLKKKSFFSLIEKVPEWVFSAFDVQINCLGINAEIPIIPMWTDIEIDIGERTLTGKMINAGLEQSEPDRLLTINVKSISDVRAIKEKSFGLTRKLYSTVLRPHNEDDLINSILEDTTSQSSKERFLTEIFQFRTSLYELANELPNIRK